MGITFNLDTSIRIFSYKQVCVFYFLYTKWSYIVLFFSMKRNVTSYDMVHGVIKKKNGNRLRIRKVKTEIKIWLIMMNMKSLTGLGIFIFPMIMYI